MVQKVFLGGFLARSHWPVTALGQQVAEEVTDCVAASLGQAYALGPPRGAVCIIPIGSQHRGRLFLPFAVDAPKTAEIVSKALLLARDREIKDPTILEQLRAG